ncbi:AAA family ATPase [Microbulbifer sp. JTAC008]|uniref:AAA family ATPase n=1 Tax=unclassified Microbulbifer TaxID=2619833 RepID=UPI004039E36C
MKIAISGSHCTGKTTILDDLGGSLDNFEIIEEPYILLEEKGHEFSDSPSEDDFISQLDYSIELITSSQDNRLFERCPLDFVAYINTINNNSVSLEEYREQILEAMELIDIVIFVPVENPDRIRCPESENPELRKEVDIQLQDLIYEFEDSSGFRVIEIRGNPKERIQKITSFLDSI